MTPNKKKTKPPSSQAVVARKEGERRPQRLKERLLAQPLPVGRQPLPESDTVPSSATPSASSPPPSRGPKSSTFSTTSPLTPSELHSLQQDAKSLNAWGRNAFSRTRKS